MLVQEAGDGPPIILVHGFGASARQWRRTIPVLAQRHKVYAIDLLGFGESEKAVLDYKIELWRDQVIAFASEVVQEPAVLVGNSIGSLVSLAAMHEASDSAFRGATLLNTSGAAKAHPLPPCCLACSNRDKA